MRVDCHCHILYGVDDASKQWQDSLTMLQIAVQDGIDVILATSHVHPKFPENNKQRFDCALAQVQQLVKEYQLPIRIVKGGEIFFSHQCPDMMNENRLITMGSSRCLLTELPWIEDEQDQDADVILTELLNRGYIPVIAHPERYAIVHENYDRLRKWKAMGCYLQTNRTSLLGLDRMAMANQTAEKMLEDGLIDLIASDAHRSFPPRIPVLSDIHALIEQKQGKAAADRLCGETAYQLFQLDQE